MQLVDACGRSFIFFLLFERLLKFFFDGRRADALLTRFPGWMHPTRERKDSFKATGSVAAFRSPPPPPRRISSSMNAVTRICWSSRYSTPHSLTGGASLAITVKRDDSRAGGRGVNRRRGTEGAGIAFRRQQQACRMDLGLVFIEL